MNQVIAIGGGGFRRLNNQNFALERYIIEQSGKKNPKIGFLPQASCEQRDYIVSFYEMCEYLGAHPKWFSLFGRVENGWQKKLLEQDIIYVGGGNTRSMLALWREWGVDRLLRQAYEKGIVLCGVSAGAICWFEQGITDSVWPLGTLECLGFIEGSCCPHYDSEAERRPFYQKEVKQGSVKKGIALEDRTAAHYKNGQLYTVVSELSIKSAFQVTSAGDLSVNTVYIGMD